MNRLAIACCLAALAAGRADADELRHTKPGQPIPDFSLPTLDGEGLGSADLRGRTVVLVFLSARQRQSEEAAAAAAAVWRELHDNDLSLVFATADTGETGWFRRLRATGDVRQPILLDAERRLYGGLGLIVLPTTIVIDPDWKLTHVISSYKADYKHVLTAYIEHAMGRMSDEELQRRLETSSFDRDRPEDRIARHRAAARILRESGLAAEAEKELRAALEIEAAHDDARLDLAALLIDQDRLDEATALVEEVLQTNPGHRRGRLVYGVVLYHRGKLDQAEAVLSETLLVNPDPVQNHYYLGLIYERKGDQAKALYHYKHALSRLLQDRPL